MTEYGDLPGGAGGSDQDDPAENGKPRSESGSGSGSGLDLEGLNLPGLTDDPSPSGEMNAESGGAEIGLGSNPNTSPAAANLEPETPAYAPLGIEGQALPTFSEVPPETAAAAPAATTPSKVRAIQASGADGALESPLPGASPLRGDSPAIEPVDVPAAFAFSLMIEGHLKPEEREKLLDVLSRENVGVREVDLEPQFESGRVLIPRISEYAGILLVQALRNTRARMKLGPSDRIFAIHDDSQETADTGTRPISTQQALAQAQALSIVSTPGGGRNPSHPAEAIAVTTAPTIPNIPLPVVIDTLTASATLMGRTVEVEDSREYQEIVDNLQKELKFKAYRKGAEAIVGFKVQLTPLHVPTHYRLLVSGVAIRAKGVIDAPGTPLPSADDLGGGLGPAGGSGEISV